MCDIPKEGDILDEHQLAAGWHYCPDWDFMLIGPHYPEVHGCTCHIESCRPGVQ